MCITFVITLVYITYCPSLPLFYCNFFKKCATSCYCIEIYINLSLNNLTFKLIKIIMYTIKSLINESTDNMSNLPRKILKILKSKESIRFTFH